jgi:hypothetical protein
LPRRSPPVPPAGSQPPCRAGPRVNPDLSDYRKAFASARVPYRLRRPRPDGQGPPGTYAWHGPGERSRLTTCRTEHRWGEEAAVDRGEACVCRRTVHTHRAYPRAVLALAPNGRSRSALVTIRHVKAAVAFAIPISPTMGPACGSPSPPLLRA